MVLPGGTFAQVEVRGRDTDYPQILSAYDAVARWAQQHQRPLVGPPREIYLDQDHFIVGRLVGSAPGGTA